MKQRLIMLVLLMRCFSMNSFAYDFKVNGIYYDVLSETENTLEVTYKDFPSYKEGNKSYDGEVIIPSTIVYKKKNYTVVGIDKYAFQDCNNLESVVIPGSVKEIEESSFSMCCYLENVTISSGVTSIGDCAFYHCVRLKSITIPNTVTSIGKEAFFECHSLASITLPSFLKSIEYRAFWECTSFTSITIPNSVTSIGKSAFKDCTGLTNITLPNSVTSIGEYAFSGCTSFTSITIPNSVENINCNAFGGCENLEYVVVPDNAKAEITYSSGWGKTIFGKCKNLKSIKGHNNPYPKWIVEHLAWADDNSMYKWAKELKEYSYKFYAYNRIVDLLTEWQQKKEYETTAQWKSRVTEQERKEQLKSIQNQVLAEFIEQKKPQKVEGNIGSYDADYGVFPIETDDWGKFYLQVPVADAPKVKSSWSSVVIGPQYGILNDRLAVVAATCNVGGKTYRTKDVVEEHASDVAINLPPLKIDFGEEEKNETKPATPRPIENSIDLEIPVSTSSNTNTFAVIIGNENYSQVSKVPYALNDAKIFATYCQKTLGLPQKNIKIYTDATFGILLSAVDNIKKIAEAYKGNLNVIFYYAGHGLPNEDSKDAFLLPVDADGRNTAACYATNKLYEELAGLGAKSVTVFMDACFSGAQRGEGMLASARGVAIKPRDVEPKGNMVVFSAASADETAYPYNEKGHGLFTYFLLKKLQESKGNATLGELGSYIREKVAQESIVTNGKSQTPTIVSSAALGDGWKNMRLK